jgi:hypothetical protein
MHTETFNIVSNIININNNKACNLCPDRRHHSPRGLCRTPILRTMLRRADLL